MLCFALRRLIDDVYRGPYEISCDATFFEDIQSGVGALVRHRAQGALPSRFSRGMRLSLRLLAVVVFPIIPCGRMDRKPVLRAHHCLVPGRMIVGNSDCVYIVTRYTDAHIIDISLSYYTLWHGEGV